MPFGVRVAPLGNRQVKDEDGVFATCAYGAADQLKTRVGTSGGMSYRSDANGNEKIVEAPGGGRTTYT
jgi:hypothetical protein